jgi:hypothetical protein
VGVDVSNRRRLTAARVRQAVERRMTLEHWKKQWRLRVVKTHFGVETARNFFIDMRYGGRCGGVKYTEFGHLGAYGTSSADYSKLRELFSEANDLRITPDDVLVDVGSGKGRVLNFWLSLGLGNKIVGVELDPEFALPAQRRLARFPNVEVVCGNALEHIPGDATIFYLFNPFAPEVMAEFRDRLAERFASSGVTVVYYFCMHRELFDDDPSWRVEPVHTKTFHPALVARLRVEQPAARANGS